MTVEPAAQLPGALSLTGQPVTGMRDGQRADPAPGPGWNVRDLASHIAGKPAVRRHLAGPARTTRRRPGPSPFPRWHRRSWCLPRRWRAEFMPAVHIGVTPFV